ncbi:hypothetical protein AAC387_Pa03g4456 [Persea americana]
MKLLWSSFMSLLIFVVLAHAQPGFISINCGMAEESIYMDTINITYHSDAKYIETGVNNNISEAFLPTTTLRQLYRNVRSFPNGSRNCYNLSETTKGTKYLLRVHMWYNNTDVNAGIRYPDDPYDLLWRPFDDINWSPFTTSFGVTNPNVVFQPPSKVMMTAVRPVNESDALQYNEPPTRDQDVEAILDIKSSYQLKRNWMGDPCVPKSYSWQGLACNYTLSHAPTILSLNLSSFGLKGEIAASLANLKSIQSLDLSWNNLTGPIPNFLGDLPFLSSLSLSGNQLNGAVPPNLLRKVNRGSLLLSIDNNPNLVTPVNDIKKSRKVIVPVLASVISTLVLLTILGFLLLKLTQRRRQRAPIVKTNSQYAEISSLPYEKRQFTYVEVLSITNNFQRSIGKGGFGTVYHGQMTNGTQVAVKMLPLRSIKFSSKCSKEFQNEVHLLMRVQHRNVVPFLGYCHEDGNMALIYEYMAQGQLGSHLSDSNSNPLSWDRRLRIALDVAQGLEYLHNGLKPPIIHRDVKTANILLNGRLEAKIGDFGLSKVFSDEFTLGSTAVKGTIGYLDPEYCNSSNLTEKSDVYSFGVVLLQLITGKPAIVRISGICGVSSAFAERITSHVNGDMFSC